VSYSDTFYSNLFKNTEKELVQLGALLVLARSVVAHAARAGVRLAFSSAYHSDVMVGAIGCRIEEKPVESKEAAADEKDEASKKGKKGKKVRAGCMFPLRGLFRCDCCAAQLARISAAKGKGKLITWLNWVFAGGAGSRSGYPPRVHHDAGCSGTLPRLRHRFALLRTLFLALTSPPLAAGLCWWSRAQLLVLAGIRVRYGIGSRSLHSLDFLLPAAPSCAGRALTGTILRMCACGRRQAAEESDGVCGEEGRLG
jgi:hypothetical protein